MYSFVQLSQGGGGVDAAEVERLRKGLAAKMATQTKVAIAKAVGVSHVTLYAYRASAGSSASVCGGFVTVAANGSTLTTQRDVVKETAPSCGETWYQASYTRTGADLTTVWGGVTVTLRKQ